MLAWPYVENDGEPITAIDRFRAAREWGEMCRLRSQLTRAHLDDLAQELAATLETSRHLVAETRRITSRLNLSRK